MEVFVDAKASQAIGIGELAEGAELLGAKRAWQFVGYFDQGHAAIIATPQDWNWRRATFLREAGNMQRSSINLYELVY